MSNLHFRKRKLVKNCSIYYNVAFYTLYIYIFYLFYCLYLLNYILFIIYYYLLNLFFISEQRWSFGITPDSSSLRLKLKLWKLWRQHWPSSFSFSIDSPTISIVTSSCLYIRHRTLCRAVFLVCMTRCILSSDGWSYWQVNWSSHRPEIELPTHVFRPLF